MIEKFQDVRSGFNEEFELNFKDIVEIVDVETIKTLKFNENTLWKDSTVAKEIMEYGKIPPLGVRLLHDNGYTGKGVNVAIIDQPVALDHPEYKGKIVEYKIFAPEGYKMQISSQHGPAVTSLLAGNNVGAAPEVNVFYAAVPQWLGDAVYEVEAVRWIIEKNKVLPEDQKIKFVSVSAAAGDPYIRPKNNELWLNVLKEAEKEGICVVDCTEGNRFISTGYVDYQSGKFEYGFPSRK